MLAVGVFEPAGDAQGQAVGAANPEGAFEGAAGHFASPELQGAAGGLTPEHGAGGLGADETIFAGRDFEVAQALAGEGEQDQAVIGSYIDQAEGGELLEDFGGERAPRRPGPPAGGRGGRPPEFLQVCRYW
jgi:hypothetical protein